MATNPVSKLTEEQYLAIEHAAEFKSEFLNGEMFAMAGASLAHARIQRNLLVELSIQLKGDCEALSSDLRVKVLASGMYTYPDVSVNCGKPLLADGQHDTLVNPIVICEVLSPSTAACDRGLKFQHYRTIESFKDYIVVEQDKTLVEHYWRQADSVWAMRDYRRPDEELKIDSISVSIPLHRIYNRVELS